MKKFLAVIIALLLLPLNAEAYHVMLGMDITCDPKKGYFEIIPQPDIEHKIRGQLEVIKDENRLGKDGYVIEDEKIFHAKCNIGKGIEFTVNYSGTGMIYSGTLDLWYGYNYGDEPIIRNEDLVGFTRPSSLDFLYHIEVKDFFLKYSNYYFTHSDEDYEICREYGINLRRNDIYEMVKKVRDIYNSGKEYSNEYIVKMLKENYDYYNESKFRDNPKCIEANNIRFNN